MVVAGHATGEFQLLGVDVEPVDVVEDAFGIVDDILRQGVQGITDLITTPGLINVDFNDVKSVMKGAGTALMGVSSARGENRALEAAEGAIASPLLEASIEGATGILLNVTGGKDMGLFEVNEAAEVVTGAADQNANVIFGAVIDQGLKDEVRVTVIATGFGPERYRRRRREQRPEEEERGAVRTPSSDEGAFEVPEDVLEVPSFLRDN